MTRPTRVLLAYNGSRDAQRALDDLIKQRAGLRKEVEVLVLCVADVWSPTNFASLGTDMPMSEHQFQTLQVAGRKAIQGARTIALEASKELRSACSGWQTRAESCAEAPAWGIIKRAEE